MSRIFKSFIYLSIPVITLLLMQWGCKKKDVFPSQQLPRITALSPASAMAGTPITIRGNNLKNVYDVRFGTKAAAHFDASANTDTAINVTVPDSLPVGPLYVQVYLPEGKGYASAQFTVLLTPPVPKIDSVSPVTAFPDDQVTISGTNFALISSVKFGGIEASFAHTLDTNGKLTAIVPMNAAGGDQYITLTNVNGADSVAFNVNLAPVITGFDPTLGAAGDIISLHGLRFNNITSVKLSAADLTYTVVNDSTITFTVPSGGQTGSVTVTNALGTAISPIAFTVQGSVAELFIYDDALRTGWWTGGVAPAIGWDNISALDNTTPVKDGTYSISCNYTNAYGGFQIGNGGATIDLADYSVVKLSIYGGPGTDGKSVELVLNAQDDAHSKVLTITEGVWTDFTIPLSELGAPATLTEVWLKEFSSNVPETIYIDNLGIK